MIKKTDCNFIRSHKYYILHFLYSLIKYNVQYSIFYILRTIISRVTT